MRFAYKYRLYPTKVQVLFLKGQLREACDLYNAALQERRVGTHAPCAGSRHLVMWLALKSYCNAPGSGVRGVT